MTECVSPPELDISRLLQYLDGDGNPSIAAHLDACAHCRTRLLAIQKLQDGLRGRLYRVDCPPAMTLGEYHRNMLGRQEQNRIARHVADCPNCREELAALDAFLQSTAFPAEARPGAIRQLSIRVAEFLSQAGAARRPGLVPVGVRGEAGSLLLFKAGATQIALQPQTAPDQPAEIQILGLITGEETGGWTAHLWRNKKLVGSFSVDDYGNFKIDSLVSGKYELFLVGPESEIHIQDIQI